MVKIRKFLNKYTLIYLVCLSISYICWGACFLCIDLNSTIFPLSPILYSFLNRLHIPVYNIGTAIYVQVLFLMVLSYFVFVIFGSYLITKLLKKEKISYKFYAISGPSLLFSFLLPILLSFARKLDPAKGLKEYVDVAGSSFLISLIFDFFIVLAFAFVILLIFMFIHIFRKPQQNSENSEVSLINDPFTVEEENEIFVGLKRIDKEFKSEEKIVDDELTLKEIADKFRIYLAVKEKLYFDIDIIRAFLASFAASRLIILEGLSGTGKSSLPRYFSQFIKEEVFFAPVQATWRDRTNLIGYYNDFSKTFKETDFLIRLYKASYKPNHINIMVLDELNLSRIEYYFADFLSILEYPSSDWKLTLIQKPADYEEPKKLNNCAIQIPENTWFVGTANKDDSTYIITDKVYDRALVLEFEDRNEPFDIQYNQEEINLSFSKFNQLLNEACENTSYQYNSNDDQKFRNIINFTYETFNVTFGNRIMNQIQRFVPAYVSFGGTKDEALDLMFAKKILRKLEGRYEDYVFVGLTKLLNLIQKTYGKGVFKLTEKAINNLLKKTR